MIHIFDIGIDLKVFNMHVARSKLLKQAYKEVSIKVYRPDGLIEERSCKMVDLLNFVGFGVHVEEEPK